MEDLNGYLYNVYNSMSLLNNNGFIKKVNYIKFNKYDKRVLNKIFSIYKIYKYKINKNIFYRMVGTYSILTNKNFIKSGIDISNYLEKIMVNK